MTAFGMRSVRLGDGVTAEIDRICSWITTAVRGELRRRGAVVGLSGGIDSSVVAALCTRALGTSNVLGLFMNEVDSSEETVRLGRLIATHLELPTVDEDLSPMLAAAGCYTRRDDAIRMVVPEY